jgi:hypothetical protein
VKIAVLRVYGSALAQQWPARPPAEFRDVEFQFDDATGADHVIVLSGVGRRTQVFCQPERVWLMIQEPPVPHTRNIYRAQAAFHRTYAPDGTHPDPRWHTYWGALNWWVGKSYDELAVQPYPTKTTDLCFITSNETLLEGHRKRLAFLDGLRASGIAFELWGRGFHPLPDKWDALSRSRYAIAFENYRGSDYWTEKLADCFLAYSTPFYYGASDIGRYFPPKSYVPLDPDDPLVFDRIGEIVASGFHEENKQALLEARELCLTKYNTLFFVAREVQAFAPPASAARAVTIRKLARPERFPRNLDLALRDLLRPLIPGALMQRYRQWRGKRAGERGL